MVPQRATAAKISIEEIVKGTLITRQGDRVVGVETHLGQVSRVNVIATVVDRFEGRRDEGEEEKRYATITIDDGTDVIRVKMWGSDCERIEGIEVGDLVLVIGKIRRYQEETYINGEIVRKLDDPNWETVRILELVRSRAKPHPLKASEPKEEERQESGASPVAHQTELTPRGWQTAAATLEQQTEAAETLQVPAELRRKIIQTIEAHDEEGGAHFEQILKAAGNASEEEIEQVLIDLLSEGLIYEPEIHRYKRS
ncbi:MAG: OB-fold nucleic acid binding domain-containing protein [Promethearchaeota archaeon]